MRCLGEMVSVLTDINQFTREARLKKLIDLFVDSEQSRAALAKHMREKRLQKSTRGSIIMATMFRSKRDSFSSEEADWGSVHSKHTLKSTTKQPWWVTFFCKKQKKFKRAEEQVVDSVFTHSAVTDAHSMGGSSLPEAHVDSVLFDLMMFDDVSVVESSLSLIMAYHNRKRSFLLDAKQVQLLKGASHLWVFSKVICQQQQNDPFD
jgi:hypothetical protein